MDSLLQIANIPSSGVVSTLRLTLSHDLAVAPLHLIIFKVSSNHTGSMLLVGRLPFSSPAIPCFMALSGVEVVASDLPINPSPQVD